MGQQVLTLGLATEEAFLPLDSQIYVSSSKAKSLKKPYKDGRSVVAKRYQEATEQNKLEMADQMICRAKRTGLEAEYLVADAWFGTKSMLRTALKHDISAILRMKKSALKYRIAINNRKKELLDAKALYKHVVKKKWQKISGVCLPPLTG